MKVIATKHLVHQRTSTWGEMIPYNGDDSSDVLYPMKRGRESALESVSGPVKPLQQAKKGEDITLWDKQYEAVQKVIRGESVLLTGPAGTGKSHVLTTLSQVVSESSIAGGVFFTAPTGIAACNIGGQTIHSWAGIGLGKGTVGEVYAKVQSNKGAMKRWRKAKILFIDEVSMMSAKLFDTLSAVGSRIRNDLRPFGGIQLVLSGDFYQLPPVVKGDATDVWLFKSKAFTDVIQPLNTIALEKVFRQKDSHFLLMLHEIRRGDVSDATHEALLGKDKDTKELQKVQSTTKKESVPTLTRLFATNKEADMVNQNQIKSLVGQGREFTAVDNALSDQYLNLLDTVMVRVPKKLELKVGALVVLTKNIDQDRGLVNGSKGIVVGFLGSDGCSLYDGEGAKLSEEKGASQDVVESTLYAQEKGPRPDISLIASIMMGEYDHTPFVEFQVIHNGKARSEHYVVVPEAFNIESGGIVMASRTQLPLLLAWALTIHKSQGMTLHGLRAYMGKIFEFGQAYVALSRATDWEGLQISGYRREVIKADPTVKKYYDDMSAANAHLSKSTDAEIFEGPIKILREIFEKHLKATAERARAKLDMPIVGDEWIEAHKYVSSQSDMVEVNDFLETVVKPKATPVQEIHVVSLSSSSSRSGGDSDSREGRGFDVSQCTPDAPHTSAHVATAPPGVSSGYTPYKPNPTSYAQYRPAALQPNIAPNLRPHGGGLTADQEERIRENRNKALQKKAQRMAEGQGHAENFRGRLVEMNALAPNLRFQSNTTDK